MDKKAQLITKKQFLLMVALIVIVALIFGNGWLSSKITVFVIGLFLVNPTLSLIIGSCIEKFGGGFLKDISFNYEIYGFKFSRTAFAILVLVLVVIIRYM